MPLMVGERIDWPAQEVRATIFAAPNPMPRIDDLFLEAFGIRPQNYQEAPLIGVPGGSGQASGLGSLGQQFLTRGPGRYDLLIQPTDNNLDPAPHANAGSIPHASIADTRATIVQVCDASKRLASALHRAARVAFSVSVVQPTASYMEANAAMNTILPLGIVLAEQSDFALQYNDKFFDVPTGLNINVFSRWLVSAIQTINIIGGGINTGSASAQIVSQYFIAQKTIDANSDPSSRVLGEDEMTSLIDTLVSHVETAMTIS